MQRPWGHSERAVGKMSMEGDKGARPGHPPVPVSDGGRGGLRASQDLTLSAMRSHWKDLSWSDLSHLPLQGPPCSEELD